ncbi:hypothetical protein [Rhodococcus globerulus]|nr:hypothetical protein [Rhodococcus globerulus]
MENITQLPDQYRARSIELLAPLGMLDAAHRKLNLTLDRIPSAYYGTWPRDLAWGVDSCVAASRLLLAGQLVAAATIARQQLERWTAIMAPVVDVHNRADEGIQDFIARAWTAYAERGDGSMPDPGKMAESLDEVDSLDDGFAINAQEPDDDHEHVFLSNGEEVCPAITYGILSEIMHARLCEGGLWWEAAELLDRFNVPDVAHSAVSVIADALSLSLIQIRYMTAAALFREGLHSDALGLIDRRIWLDRYSPPTMDDEDLPPEASSYPLAAVLPTLQAVMPLAPGEGLAECNVRYLAGQRARYQSLAFGIRPEGRLYRDDEFATLAFTAHRHASARFALRAMEVECEQLGDKFDVEALTSRGTDYVIIAELAGVAALWTRQSPALSTASAPLALVSSTLRSAYWLWLEDDDRAMASLRCTLEQIATVRVIRMKPDKAVELASRYSKPQRWIEAAGWKRLAALNRALGEYAHAHKDPNWAGARNLLKELQLDANGENAIYTARGHALELLATLVARETISILSLHSEEVAKVAFTLVSNYSGIDPSDAALDAIMNNSHRHRTRPLA